MLRILIVAITAFLLVACGDQPAPTPTPTKTPMPADTPTPLPPAAAVATAENPQSTPTAGAFVATVAAGAVAKVNDDAIAFVLEKGAANVTADQLTAAMIGVLGRLQRWSAGTGGATALADCTALLPGVIARADNKQPLEALLAACQGGDPAAVSAALAPLLPLLP